MLTESDTLIIFLQMSDVEQGGGTVFTAINLPLWPKKGSAAFWYNLKPNGEGNYKTRHAACPVLTGTKWGKISVTSPVPISPKPIEKRINFP